MAVVYKAQLPEIIKRICEQMDREAFEKLIADQPHDVQAKGVLLFNGLVTCRTEYKQSPTAANLRHWQAAQEAFEKFAARLGAAEGDRPLLTLADVLEYLSPDWKVTRTSLYRHHKEGKLLPQADGSYSIRDVEKYARTWLRQKSTGKRLSEKMDELQRKKIELELQNLEIERKRKELAYGKDLDRYIPREQMEIELASRAGVLYAGLSHWIQSRAAEWIRLPGGDTTKVGELINVMIRSLDDHINTYAAPVEYEVFFDAGEDEAADGAEDAPPSTEDAV